MPRQDELPCAFETVLDSNLFVTLPGANARSLKDQDHRRVYGGAPWPAPMVWQTRVTSEAGRLIALVTLTQMVLEPPRATGAASGTSVHRRVGLPQHPIDGAPYAFQCCPCNDVRADSLLRASLRFPRPQHHEQHKQHQPDHWLTIQREQTARFRPRRLWCWRAFTEPERQQGGQTRHEERQPDHHFDNGKHSACQIPVIPM